MQRRKDGKCLHNLKVPGEAECADGEAAASSLGDGAKIIQEGGYTDRQIISVDKAAFCQKETRLATFLAREKSTPGFEASKDRPTLLLGLMQLVT